MTLPDLITKHASENPGATAYIFQDKKISYGELEDHILRCAAGLAKRGIKSGSTFGLVLRNSPDFVIIVMALAKVGAIAVPINFLEKPERIALILNDAKAVGVLTSKEFLAGIKESSKTIPTLKMIFSRDGAFPGVSLFSELLEEEPTPPHFEPLEDDVMMLLYTAGTTGEPKGVMLTHGNFLANIDQCMEAISLSKKDRFLCLLPMFHSFAWTTCVLIPLKMGAASIIIESLLPFSPIITQIWKHHATVFVAVPQIFGTLVSRISRPKAFLLRFLNPIRFCISGAAPLMPTIHRNFEKTFGVPLLEGYGLTETSPVVSLNTGKRKIGSVGRPLPGVQIRIVQDDEGTPVGPGDVGEIWVSGKNVMKGYYHKPDETKHVMTKDGWFKTGDMGKMDKDGFLSLVDRKKDLIIVRGLNVYPQEIENVILQHDAVKEVAVVGKRDEKTGDEIIRAFVTEKEGKTIDKSKLNALCRERLAPFKRPKDIIVINEMPKNAIQKILKKELRDR